MASKVSQGDIVLYRPRIDDPKFHNKGHQPQLPAVVVKVWDNVADLQILWSADLHVLQDATCPLTFVPFVKQGDQLGEYSLRG